MHAPEQQPTHFQDNIINNETKAVVDNIRLIWQIHAYSVTCLWLLLNTAVEQMAGCIALDLALTEISATVISADYQSLLHNYSLVHIQLQLIKSQPHQIK
jgi:hypothetical protein